MYSQEYTDRKFGEGASNNGEGCSNAFKHTFLAALRVKTHGLITGRALVEAHEEGQPNYDPEDDNFKMDIRNNAIGVSFGNWFNGRKEDMTNLIYNKAINGELWSIDTSGNQRELKQGCFY